MRARIKVKGLKFRVPLVIERDTAGFHVYSPALKGLHVDGGTEEEALRIGREAVKLHLESMIEDGDPIPLSIVKGEEGGEPPEGSKEHHLEEVIVDCR